MNIPVSLGGFITLTNVGASYDATNPSFGLGSALIDFTGITQVDFSVGVSKIGTGTQSWQLWNATDGTEICVIDDAGVTGNKVLNAATANVSLTGVKLVRVRCKSTVALDDPLYYGAGLLLKRPDTTFERAGFITQLIGNVYGLTRDMRDNATNYKARVTAGQNIATIAAVMVADAGLYLTRIGWINDAVTNNQTLVTNTLADLGLTLSQATSLRDTLTTVAQHTQAAALTTGAQINTESDFILASVPSYARLW